MIQHTLISAPILRSKIRSLEIRFAGNKNLKIYGLLQCRSGKRMKRENRVFFATEQEALQNNFRPCGHCMKNEYKKWKESLPFHRC
ncbi:Ada metal-binding domain-containing protein [Chryseobacterium sp. YR221]|uniref:Ada metal-binding domain-containing protein n=1 Tax=Chryseobacterium sp. YR221 TaxID=1500293 RepID=UPI0009D82232|nr:Ada metal-binding domain-containing protein [Chryseobacterium sp. YR221]SMC31252.1 Metal binding domain of Ada [Chryseobacterium sp. YR221]